MKSRNVDIRLVYHPRRNSRRGHRQPARGYGTLSVGVPSFSFKASVGYHVQCSSTWL